MVIHVDSCFLIDYNREMVRRESGPVSRKLAELPDETFAASVHVAAELFAGAEQDHDPAQERSRVDQLLEVFPVVYPDERFAPEYGRLAAYLRRTGQEVATMDLLVATSAIVEGAPLLTRDVDSFCRVPGLDVLGY